MNRVRKRSFWMLLLIVYLTITPSISQEKIIATIKIEGLKKTKESTILKLLSVQKGEKLDSLEIAKNIARLKRLPAISYAYFKTFPEKENSYNLHIYIEENFTLIPNVNFWTTTNRRIAYKLGLYEYNFLGKNMVLGGFYQQNGFNSYGINFRAPTLFSKHFGLALNYQNWGSEEPLYFEEQSANYKYQNISYEVLGLYQFNFRNSIEVGINFFKEKYTYLSGYTSANVPQKLDVNKKLLKFVYTYDNLNYFYHYIEGFKNQLYAQYVTTVNPYQDDFFIAWNDVFYFKRIGEKGNWANRLRVGLSSNANTPFAPFALDNNLNLRGVGILVDRGTGSIVWNTEYRYTLYERKWFVLQGNIFTDVGSWRSPGGKLSDFVQHENIKMYSGLGLRFINKKIFNAVFRIDYGYGITPNSSKGFVFGVGQYF